MSGQNQGTNGGILNGIYKAAALCMDFKPLQRQQHLYHRHTFLARVPFILSIVMSKRTHHDMINADGNGTIDSNSNSQLVADWVEARALKRRRTAAPAENSVEQEQVEDLVALSRSGSERALYTAITDAPHDATIKAIVRMLHEPRPLVHLLAAARRTGNAPFVIKPLVMAARGYALKAVDVLVHYRACGATLTEVVYILSRKGEGNALRVLLKACADHPTVTRKQYECCLEQALHSAVKDDRSCVVRSIADLCSMDMLEVALHRSAAKGYDGSVFKALWPRVKKSVCALNMISCVESEAVRQFLLDEIKAGHTCTSQDCDCAA